MVANNYKTMLTSLLSAFVNEFDCCSKFQSEKACEENVENLDMTSEILKIVKIIQR